MTRYIWIMFTMVLLVAGTRFFLSDGSLWKKWQRENFWLKKANTQEKFELLVLGDSRIYHSVQPSELNRNGFNFAFPAMSYTPHYLQAADSLIQANGIVLLGLTVESLTSFESDKSLRNYEKKGPLPFYQTTALVRAFWPTIDLQQLLITKKIPVSQLLPSIEPEILHESGWIEGLSAEHPDFEMMKHHYREMVRKYRIELPYVIALKQKIQSWKERGIRVFFFWACFEEEVCDEENKIWVEGQEEGLENELISAGSRKINVEGNYETFDGDHLKGSEALRFSKDLAAGFKEVR